MNIESRIGMHILGDIWKYYHSLKNPEVQAKPVEWKYVNGALNALGLGLEPTIEYLISYSNSFSDFEDWIEKNGSISKDMINYFNKVIQNEENQAFFLEEPVFGEEDMTHWNDKGYVILKQAVSRNECEKAIEFITSQLNVDLNDPSTWYESHPLKQGIMVQLFNDEILNKIRLAKRVRLAFEQLWEKNNLLPTMDRVSFNPPETEHYRFPGPNLHWDVSLKTPIPFGLQGLLYLNDVKEDQGAFTVIPGFHRIIEDWVKTLTKHPRELDLLENFKEQPIAAGAGDLIIWNHCLPHGSRPNKAKLPRIVQYINYQPIHMEYQSEWI